MVTGETTLLELERYLTSRKVIVVMVSIVGAKWLVLLRHETGLDVSGDGDSLADAIAAASMRLLGAS